MDNPSGTHPGDTDWQGAIDLLKFVQADYEGARKQLEDIGHALARSQALVAERLQYALTASGGFRTLCLLPFVAGNPISRMGSAILGGVARPSPLPARTRLEVRCFGRFQVSRDHRQVERWRSVKAKSVLQYLVTRPGGSVMKDVLMNALWPDCAPQAANNNLKAAVHGIRQTLGSLFEDGSFPYVLFVQGNYRINPEAGLWVDVAEFERRWTEGRRLEKEGRPAEAMNEFEAAEALYRGDYLEDEPYEEWTLLRREALKDTYVMVLGKLADYAIQRGDYEGCLMYCHKVLAKDPCREDAYRRLMLCCARLGQRNRALSWYDICHKTIQAELRTTPDRDTTALYHRVRDNQPV